MIILFDEEGERLIKAGEPDSEWSRFAAGLVEKAGNPAEPCSAKPKPNRGTYPHAFVCKECGFTHVRWNNR